MTKLRGPATFEQAIVRIAGRIGYDGCSAAVGKGERQVRNWSDPDHTSRPDILESLKLDLAYRLAGGGEAPILAAFARQLDILIEQSPSDAAEIAAAGARAAQESGQAVAAILLAAQPGASPQAMAHAAQEVEEAQVAFGDVLAKVRPPARGP